MKCAVKDRKGRCEIYFHLKAEQLEHLELEFSCACAKEGREINGYKLKGGINVTRFQRIKAENQLSFTGISEDETQRKCSESVLCFELISPVLYRNV